MTVILSTESKKENIKIGSRFICRECETSFVSDEFETVEVFKTEHGTSSYESVNSSVEFEKIKSICPICGKDCLSYFKKV